jgi:hypothetical protein
MKKKKFKKLYKRALLAEIKYISKTSLALSIIMWVFCSAALSLYTVYLILAPISLNYVLALITIPVLICITLKMNALPDYIRLRKEYRSI